MALIQMPPRLVWCPTCGAERTTTAVNPQCGDCHRATVKVTRDPRTGHRLTGVPRPFGGDQA